MKDLARKTVDGATLNIGAIMIKTAVQFVVVMPILARLVPPEQFGLVGMAMAFIIFFTMLNDLGISAALVRAEQPSPRFWTSAFWTNIALGSLLTSLTFLAAPAIAAFFREPVVEPLVEALAFVLLLHCSFLVPMAWLQRHFRFATIAVIDLTATVIAAAIAIWTAHAGFGVWALVFQQLAMFGSKAVGGFLFQRAPLLAGYDVGEIARVLPFSLRLTGSAFIGFFTRNIDSILIGRFLGAAPLGLYGRAYQVMLMPVNTLSQGANFALYPALSAIKDDTDRLGRVYLRVLSLLALVTLPMMTGLALVAEPFVAVLFGPNWAPMVPVLTFLCFAGIIQSLVATSNVMWTALGHSEVLLRWSLVRMVCFVSSFIIGIALGSITAVGCAFLIANIALYPPFQLAGLRRLGLPVAEFIEAVGPALGGTALMALVVLAAQLALPGLAERASHVQLGLLVPLGAATYGMALIILFPRYLQKMVREGRDLLRRRAAPAE